MIFPSHATSRLKRGYYCQKDKKHDCAGKEGIIMKNMKKKNALFNRKAFSQRMKKNTEMFEGDRRNADPDAVEISIYSLAAEGVSQRRYPRSKMLPAAKSRTYAKITKALNSGSDIADRQIAEAIYNGRQAIDNDIILIPKRTADKSRH